MQIVPELVIKLPAGQVAVLSSLKLKSLGGPKRLTSLGRPVSLLWDRGAGFVFVLGLGFKALIAAAHLVVGNER